MSKFDNYPYLIHTNRELELMLDGTKPLAVFCVDNVVGENWFTKEMAQANQIFDPYVATGLFNIDHMQLKKEAEKRSIVLEYIAYTVQGERWRSQAYFELLRILHQGHCCQNLERYEGTLLGYTDEENDYHIKNTYGACGSKC